ncbi:MAG: hypothetical protein MUF35_00115 [Candidatus Nanopelagicales bacterium]|nr:hypothetical protein [Candidatus Nanopelagicales bacterium]
MTARWWRICAVALLLVGATGCGVQLQDAAEPLPEGALPAGGPAASEPPPARLTKVHFVNGGALEGVVEPMDDRSANGVLAALATGPPVDRAELRTLVLDPATGTPIFQVQSVSPYGEVVLRRGEGFGALPALDQVLLTGQVVLSLDEVGLSRVVVVDEAGTPVPVTLPDLRVVKRPITASDFDDLLVP